MFSERLRFHLCRFLAGCAAVTFCLGASVLSAAPAPTLAQQVQQLESSGDLSSARGLLDQEAGSAAGAEQKARFLDRHNEEGRRAAYLKWASLETSSSRKLLALRQVVLDDVLDGNSDNLATDLTAYHSAGGSDLNLPKTASSGNHYSAVMIPGPMSSFARLAALSPDLAPEDLLPSLARNLTTSGFEAAGNEALQPTEYLRLLTRYVNQARELQALGNGEHKIVIPSCDTEQAGALLKVLGYRMRGSCGSDLVLETVNPTRAFLTVDSAFPLTQLEQDLRANRRFELTYAPTPVPVLYENSYWLTATGRPATGDFLDAFLSEPALCRLYLGLSHVDAPVADALREQMPPAKLRLYANVLDFYGSMLHLESGAVAVPGSQKSWASIAGTSPSNVGPFLEKLLTTDDGWLMSYYDSLMRMHEGPVYTYLTQPERLKRFYDALRGKVTTPGPARPVFRSSTELVIFTTSLWAEPNGSPHIPGDLEVWRTLFIKHPHGKYDGKLTRSAATWKGKDDLLEALFALSRKAADNEPLQIFLALNDIDRNRSHAISASLAARLISSYRSYGAQYGILADAPGLGESSIGTFLDLCAQNPRDSLVKSDRAGSLQALIELWRILCRQNIITLGAQEHTFASLLAPWDSVTSEADVFAAARKGVEILTALLPASSEAATQEHLVASILGPVRTADNAPPAPAALFWKYFDAQLLIPYDALFSAADHLGKDRLDPKVVTVFHDRQKRLEEATEVHEGMSREEKSVAASGYWTEHHSEIERKFSLEAAGKTPEKKDIRAALAPFLRDTLVGMVYCYYAPAGSEVLLSNPSFVRTHDFVGVEGTPDTWRSTEMVASGWPGSTGGRLTGSLDHLPYALAQAEQNFLVPRKEQALIWADLVPQLIINVTIARWNNVQPEQLRWVALHIRRGRNLMAAAVLSPDVESSVMVSLSRFLTPGNLQRLHDDLHTAKPANALNSLPPSYLYALADDPKLASLSPDVTSVEIAALSASANPSVSPAAISRTFGTPKPTLTHSLTPVLMYLRTFPTLMGYSSRLMAESWESNNLFYAALADEAGVRCADLDIYVPQWNRMAIENIFATHLEDWPALIRSLNLTEEAVLHPATAQPAVQVASGN